MKTIIGQEDMKQAWVLLKEEEAGVEEKSLQLFEQSVEMAGKMITEIVQMGTSSLITAVRESSRALSASHDEKEKENTSSSSSTTTNTILVIDNDDDDDEKEEDEKEEDEKEEDEKEEEEVAGSPSPSKKKQKKN